MLCSQRKHTCKITLATLVVLFGLSSKQTTALPCDKGKAEVANCSARGLSVNKKQMQAIENYIDTNEDPCEYFYGYACNNWEQHHDNEHYSEGTGLIDHKVNKKLVNLLEAYEPNSDSMNIYNKVWTYYKACKHEKTAKLIKYLQIVRPVEPLNWAFLQLLKADISNDTNTEVQSWPAEQFNWLLTLAKLRRYGLTDVLIEHIVLQRNDNASQYIIDLDKAAYDGDKRLPNEVTIMVYLNELGANSKLARQITKELIEFEEKIIHLLERMDRYVILEKTVADLEFEIPQMPWRNYLEIVLNRSIDYDFQLQIRNWDYFAELITLMEHTPSALISHYIMFRFIYYLTLDGSKSSQKIDCLSDLRSKMDLAMNFIYKEQFYRNDDDAENYNKSVQRIFDLIRTEFTRKLEENKLQLGLHEQQTLKIKLEHMQLNIGNLPKNADRQFIEQSYSSINLDLRNYHKNHLALLEWRSVREHADLFNVPHTNADFYFVIDSNTARSSSPFYLLRHNLIIVPLGLLQPPMFHRNMHDVFKMSVFGFLLAHEIAHGFDASGINYDHRGNFHALGRRISSSHNFSRALKCMQGRRTKSINERIADIVGVRLAYDALFGANTSLHVQQPKFTIIPMKRLFFLHFAQFFCGNSKSQFEGHDSDNIRLEETLLNFKPFSQQFQCDLGAVMHPEERCRLW